MDITTRESHIIEDLEGCYAQLILSMYTIYCHSSDPEIDNYRTKQEHSFRQGYVQIIMTPMKDDFCKITMNVPIQITPRIEREILNRIWKLEKEYQKGFIKFMEETENQWYEPLRNITIYDILKISHPLILDESRTAFIMAMKYRSIPSFYPQEWMNRYFYEYKRNLPSLYNKKKVLYEEETMKLIEEYNELCKKFSINLSTEDFHSSRNELQRLGRRIETSYEEFAKKPMLFNHTNNDEATIALLKKFGYETCQVI